VNISRRDFIDAGCVIGAAALVLNKADAVFPGNASVSLNNNRVTINVPSVNPGLFLNQAKGFNWSPMDPTTVSSDGYPLSTPSTNIACNPFLDKSYYGYYAWKFSGRASMQISSGGPLIVGTGGAHVGLRTDSGDFKAGDNISIVDQTNPRVVFAFGFNIQSISQGASNGLGGNLIRVGIKTNYFNGFNYTGVLVTVAGTNSNTGAIGLWTMNQIDNQTFDLIGSIYTNPQASAAGTAITQVGGTTIYMLALGTYSGFSNLVWCRLADETAVANGQIIDNDIISQFQYLMNSSTSLASRGWARFMDLSAVQGSFECDWSQRIPATALCYSPTNYRPGYWAGAITNGGSDSYTCSDPSVSTWSGSAYIDNAIVQGFPSATNTGGLPTLAVGGHPGKPIVYWNDGITPFILALSGPPPSPGTDVLQFTFQASWLNGGTPHVFSYPTVSGDASLATFNANLETALAADRTLFNNKIFTINPNNGQVGAGPYIQPRTPHAGALTITYSSGPAVCTVQNMRTSKIDNTTGGTFIYNYLLDAWIYMDGGMYCSIPFEVIVEFCNRAGTHCWYNIGTTKGAFLTALGQFFGDSTTGLTNGLRFGTETYNEVWNSGASPFAQLGPLGASLGWSYLSEAPNFSYTSLRTIQYSSLIRSAWTGKGRSASDYYIFQMCQYNQALGGDFDRYQCKGQALNPSSFPTYGSYGGLNGSGASPDYSTTGNRPIDITTALGFAPYWGNPWWNTNAGDINGTVAVNAPWLQASLDYVNGNTAIAFTSLANQFNGTTTRSSGGANALSLSDYVSSFQNYEAMAAQYDSYRVSNGLTVVGQIHYEGGPQWAVGNNGVNGTNSATDNGPLIAQLNSIWSAQSVAAYTVSGTDNKTELANQVLPMMQGWKYDTDHNGNPANTGSYKNLVETSYYQALKTVSGANRETKPAQYGYQATTWAYFPVTLLANNPYQSYVAAREWNAGG
jgi:hypothetical protein